MIDERALFEAFATRRISGAALDCVEYEPITAPHRCGGLENVLLAPHAIAWILEMFRDIGRTAGQSIVEVAHGRRPAGVTNPEVLERPTFQRKWHRLKIA